MIFFKLGRLENLFLKALSFFTIPLLLLFSCSKSLNEKYKTHKDRKLYTHQLVIGTYTDEPDQGIQVFNFNIHSLAFDSLTTLAYKNPSFLHLENNGEKIFAVSENGEEDSKVGYFKKNGDSWSFVNEQFTNGAAPCYIYFNNKDKIIFTANYSGGNISSLKFFNDSIQPVFQLLNFSKESHLHSIIPSPHLNEYFSADLGDNIIYRLEYHPDNGLKVINHYKLYADELSAGPRHIVFHPSNKFFYAIGELSNRIFQFDYKAGDLVFKKSYPTDSIDSKGSADIKISSDGKFLYASNRLEHDGIAIFRINRENGDLEKIGYQTTGKHPRNFKISPNGKLLLVATRDDNQIEIYKILNNGLLEDTSKRIKVNKPVFIDFIKL